MPPSKRDRLEALIEHYQSHGPSSGFVSLYNGDDALIQYIYSGDFEDRINVVGLVTESDADIDWDGFVETTDAVEPVEDSEFEEGRLTEDYGAEELIKFFDTLLALSGLSIEDITAAAEESCPDGGTTTWNDVLDDVSEETVGTTLTVPAREDQLRGMYAELKRINDAVEGDVPTPFPSVEFFIDGEKQPFTIWPEMYCYDYSDRDVGEAFLARVQSLIETPFNPNHETGTAIIMDFSFDPDSALGVTKVVFEEFLDASLGDLTSARFVRGGETRDWGEFA